MIRPVAEYCAPVFHTLITAADSNELERIQMQALKGIFSWRTSYKKLLEKSNLERLDVRRETRFVELAKKMSDNARYATWFPLRLNRGNFRPRISERYKVYPSNTERYLKSPLNIMRQKLNDLYNE